MAPFLLFTKSSPPSGGAQKKTNQETITSNCNGKNEKGTARGWYYLEGGEPDSNGQFHTPFPAAQIDKADVGGEVKNGEIQVSESESGAS